MDNIISKINKMLELARRGGTEAESKTAQKMAEDLLTKYSLLMADIQTQTEPEDYMFEGSMTSTPRATWQDSIYVSVSRLYFCRYFKTYKHDGTATRTIVGDPEHVQTAKKVAAHIVLIALTLAKESCGNAKQLRSFKKGFAVRIWARVDEAMRKDDRGSLLDSLPEMKKAEADAAATKEANAATADSSERKNASDGSNIDRRFFNKGSSLANFVSLDLHDFLK